MGTPVWEAEIEFHEAIAAASSNAVLAKVLAPVSDLLDRARQATGTLAAAVELGLEKHDEIAAAIQARFGACSDEDSLGLEQAELSRQSLVTVGRWGGGGRSPSAR